LSDVIVIGGGLSGLAAAWELEQLGVDYTLIEVKNRLGGSIHTVEEAGFILDGYTFVIEKIGAWNFLDDLGLAQPLAVVGQVNEAELVIFKAGTGALIDALAAKISAPVMLRMAVSSLGRLDNGRFAVCLENGLMLAARALVIAAPARYAERMLRSLAPEVAYRLLDYRYDCVARVSLGYEQALAGEIPPAPPDDDYPITFWQVTDHPARVPPGHVLLRAGVRLEVEDVVPDTLALEVAALVQLPLNPAVAHVDYWAEGDPLTRHWAGHAENMRAIERLLPPGVTLVGSDYLAENFAERIAQGREAAHSTANWLRQRR
jgi:protoporphyrinogen oxidase